VFNHEGSRRFYHEGREGFFWGDGEKAKSRKLPGVEARGVYFCIMKSFAGFFPALVLF
jgi:hypothetical protein